VTVVMTVLVPVLLIVVAATGLRRHIAAWLVLTIFFAALGFGAYERLGNSCSYCEDRSLLPVAPILIFLVCVGIAVLAVSTSRAIRSAAYFVAAVVLVAVGSTTYLALMRFKDNGYFLDTPVRSVLAHLPPTGDVELEGFGEGPAPIAEQGLVYMLAEEKAWNRVSLPADFDEDGSIIYLGDGYLSLTGPQFDPNYQYVLTRLPDIGTLRRTIVRQGGVALEQRVVGLDVTPDYGLTVSTVQANSVVFLNPYPPVPEPIKFIITGPPRGTVYVRIQFYVESGARRITPTAANGSRLAAEKTRIGHALIECVQLPGRSLLRTLYVAVRSRYAVSLTNMSASSQSCFLRQQGSTAASH
jgi:hypothetical protein